MAEANGNKRLFVFYDNSNVWICGKQAYLRQLPGKSCVKSVNEYSPWRFSCERFLEILERVYNGKIKKAICYASIPPDIERVLERFPMETKTFWRSTFTRREKEVDSTLIVDALQCASALSYFKDFDNSSDFARFRNKASFQEYAQIVFNNPNDCSFKQARNLTQNTVIVLATGDGDFKTTVETLHGKCDQVCVWSWEHSISSKLTDLVNCLAKYEVRYLNEYIDEVGFVETPFNGKGLPRDRTFVLLDVNRSDSYLSSIKKFLDELPLSTYRDLFKDTFDLAVVCADYCDSDTITKVMNQCRTTLVKEGYQSSDKSIITLIDYIDRIKAKNPRVLELRNSFSELGIVGESFINNEPPQGRSVSSDDQWTTVKSKHEKAEKRAKERLAQQNQPKKRCKWGIYCTKAKQLDKNGVSKCTFHHSQEEFWKIQTGGIGRPKKYKPCRNKNCENSTSPKYCNCFHIGEKPFCPTCDSWGHQMDTEYCSKRC